MELSFDRDESDDRLTEVAAAECMRQMGGACVTASAYARHVKIPLVYYSKTLYASSFSI